MQGQDTCPAGGCVNILYHYTTAGGMIGILATQEMNPSLLANNPKDARYGDGVYFTDIIPGTMTNNQLSRTFLEIPYQGNKFTNYVGVDVAGLPVITGREHVFVVRTETPLNVTGRIIDSGTNQPGDNR